MMKTLELKKPLITSYPAHANSLSVIGGYPKAIEWFYENYVQLFAHPYGKIPVVNSYVNFFSPYPWKSCPWFEFSDIPKGILNLGWDNICKFITESLDNGYYVQLYLDNYYLTGTEKYRIEHFGHETFIYGYDDECEMFLAADFFHGPYGTLQFNYKDVYMAYKSNEYPMTKCDNFLGVVIFRLKEDNTFEFSTLRYKENIKNFLNGEMGDVQLSYGYSMQNFKFPKEYIYGVNIFGFLKKYLKSVENDWENIADIRGFHTLYDHAILLNETIKFLYDKQFILSQNIIMDSNDLISKTLILRNKVLKLRFTKRRDIGALIKSLDYISQLELKIFTGLLKELKDIG